ncbi:MAG TPA: adenylate/guanylate cyclase domain-containing protein [Mycobacteriales bacterium]|nr:adenylate/guanylate cyclase domain-containing protein [Mycobacteriales bacterium]
MSTTCPHCAAEVQDGTRFCRHCGTAVPVAACPSCGAADEGGAFCGQCGAALSAQGTHASPVAPVAERRVTSVLFGDLVGFTPLSESRDAEEVRELLSAYFAQCRVVIGRYGGVVEKFIGDAVMAVWGVPVAHEDDAERAVRAGLELVAAVAAMGEDLGIPELAMRVGVVTGEVAVTLGVEAEGMVAGDAVNTAARVQSVAEPGRVWVDETTRSLASAAITFQDVGEHALKGKAEPVRLWQAGVVVAEVGGGQRVDGLEAPLSGRDADLRLVKELFHSTQELRRPKLVVVDGEAGIGKSRLAWEFEKYADGLTATVWWHRGRCLSYGDGTAFWALSEAMRARFGLVEADAGDVVTEKLDAGLAQYVQDEGERDWLRPRLAVLLGSEAGGFAREDLFAAWTSFLEHMADLDHTVVLVVDDAQHADDGLLDFLEHLVVTARAPVFVMALARPELLQRRPSLGGRRATVLPLEPLDDDAMGVLVDGLVADLPVEARVELVARSEGVPLFAVETVRALIDRDLVIPRDGRYVTSGEVDLDLHAIGAPASLQALVAARLDALTADERRVVADASVLGLSFTRESLVALGSPPETLDAVLDSLVRKEIVAVQTSRFTTERGQYRFVQSVMRQVAYATQSRRDRKARHLACADHVASLPDPAQDLAVVVAQHLLDAAEAAPAHDPDVPGVIARACTHLERAAARACAVGGPGEGLRLLETALTHAADPVDQARLHLAAARAATDAGRDEQARTHAEQAAVLFDGLGDPLRAAQSAAAHARALLDLGDNAGAVAVAEARWRTLQGAAGAEQALVALAGSIVPAYGRMLQWDKQHEYAEHLLVLAEGLGDMGALAGAYVSLGMRYTVIGAPYTGAVCYSTAAGIARDHNLPSQLAKTLNNLASSMNTRDPDTARAAAVEGLDVARRAGLTTVVDWAAGTRLSGLWLAGAHAEVAELLAELGDTVNDPGTQFIVAIVKTWLADARGAPLEPPPTLGFSTDEVLVEALHVIADIVHAHLSGDPQRGAARADATLEMVSGAWGMEDDFGIFWPPLVLAALAAEDVDLADRLLEPVSSALPTRRPPLVDAQWHRLMGLTAAVRGDDPELVETQLRAGIDALDAFGARGYAAQAREELGHWLVEQRRPAEAEPLIEAARAAYAGMGASGWLARLEGWHAGTLAVRTR